LRDAAVAHLQTGWLRWSVRGAGFMSLGASALHNMYCKPRLRPRAAKNSGTKTPRPWTSDIADAANGNQISQTVALGAQLNAANDNLVSESSALRAQLRAANDNELGWSSASKGWSENGRGREEGRPSCS
jgi:hypothetical protein